jgi:hypothetical protein
LQGLVTWVFEFLFEVLLYNLGDIVAYIFKNPIILVMFVGGLCIAFGLLCFFTVLPPI